MTNKKTTKRALLFSLLSMLLCVTMLMGTTFAWFTDSVSSVNNIIKSGNLDVELEYYNGSAWVAVDEDTNVFSEELWEPGHTEVVYLKVSNLGTLALKYALNINVANEIESINVEGNVFRLSDYIEYDVIEGVETAYKTREEARKAAADDTEFTAIRLNKQYYNKTGVLYAANDVPTDGVSEEYIALVVYMPEEIGNEANYRTGEVAPKIDLGINLYATQQAYENDSFGNDYDKDAQHKYAPSATVIETTVKDTSMVIYDVASSKVESTDTVLTLDTAYEFRALDSVDTVALNEYGAWLADYYVSIDRPIYDGVMLAGTYEGYPWIALKAPAGDYTEAVGLLGMFSTGGISNWTYADIVDGVNVFKCGAINTNGANAGAIMTVQLRLINPENTNEYIVISETKYTFPKAVVTEPIVGDSEGTTYEGEIFNQPLTDALVVQNCTLKDNATITVKRIYDTVVLEGVTANVTGNLITSSTDNTIVIQDCDITLSEGAKLIVTTDGAIVGQVMIHNVTVNGELLTQATAAQYMEGVNWYEVW